MSYINVWIHLIWATKNRHPFLTKQVRQPVFQHIRQNAKKKGIHLDFINGYSEHVHTLISLNASQTIAEVAQALKGESSHWVNANQLTKTRFCWQNEYMGLSVSRSAVPRVREYIKSQEEHHRVKGFAEEYELFMKRYGFQILGEDAG